MTRRAVVLAFVAACGGTAADDRPDADFDPTPQLDDAESWVEISTRLYDSSGDTSSASRLITETPPWPYIVEAPVGSCRYSTLSAASCTPFCDYDEVCDQGVCVGQPAQRSAGDLVVTGGGASRTIPYVDGYHLYEQSVVFAPGTAVTVTATGADIAAFTGTTTMPAALELIGRADLRLRTGEELTVRWQPADPGSRIRLVLGADRGHALHRAALIECDLPDEAGGVTIPAATITRFTDPANWSCGDCFSHQIKRYRRDRATAGPIALDVWMSQSESIYLIPE